MNKKALRKNLPGRITFDQYRESNPRSSIPDTEMLDFLEYAEKRYIGEKDRDDVNWTHNRNTDAEKKDEVQSYLSESMEALLLYREFKDKQR